MNPMTARATRALFASVPWAIAAITLWATCGPAHAVPQRDRVSAAGYLRVMARPDFQGGGSRLGLWNINGRLLNEGPYGALELKLDALPRVPGVSDPWTSIHAKIEGGGLMGAEPGNGRLDAFRLSQLYVKAGNLLAEDLVFVMGTLHTYWGDLGLYDMRPSDLFFDTVGVAARYQTPSLEVMAGLGDAGYALHGDRYNTVLTAGATVKLRPLDRVEAGLGGQIYFEQGVAGSRFAPHRTPLPDTLDYADYIRGELTTRFFAENPNRVDDFPRPEPTDVSSYKLVGYLGFGGFGPLQWNSFYINYLQRHPEGFYTERYEGRDYAVYLGELTDERTELNVGNQLQLTVVPRLADLAVGFLYGRHRDADDSITASERNRTIWSTVVRGQVYLTPTLHFLTEYSYAEEHSEQGNLWRGHFDSVFESKGGLADSEGFEFGDLDTRRTWQLKAGFVLNPTGRGIFTRPSLRLLYGLQNSNMHSAFGNAFSQTLSDFEQFRETEDRHTHALVALEAEAWF